MENQPHRSSDDEPQGPEAERLYPSEIDMTGVVRQDDALADVIGDAISEAKADGGEVPEWGARTLARALANERDDPMSGALHHFAITGRADLKATMRELAGLSQRTTDDEIRTWVNWLGTYVIRMPNQATVTERASTSDEETPDLGSSPEELGKRLRLAFAEADARGEAITTKDARAIATVLSIFLDPDSDMARFADTGDANPALLHQECQLIRRRTEDIPGLDSWTTRFEQHLASRVDLGRQGTALPGADEQSGSPHVEQGIREAGDAFRAYLQLPDVDPSQTDLLKKFQGVYVGDFISMDELVNSLTYVQAAMVAAKEAARQWGLEEYVFFDRDKLYAMARENWDVVAYRGRLYVFRK